MKLYFEQTVSQEFWPMFFLIENYKEIENNLCVPLMRQDKAD
jgi:hypothetical protein